jgi:hypothetical protein
VRLAGEGVADLARQTVVEKWGVAAEQLVVRGGVEMVETLRRLALRKLPACLMTARLQLPSR